MSFDWPKTTLLALASRFGLAPLVVLAPLAGTGCFNPVEAPSAYEGEVDLCKAEHADELSRRVASCRKRWLKDPDSCAGVISYSGTLEDIDVVVDAELEATEIRDLQVGDLVYRERLKLIGKSPHFRFELAMKLLGESPEVGEVSRSLKIMPTPDPKSTWYEDDRADVELGLTAGTSRDIQFAKGKLVLTLQTPDEHAGTFEGTNPTGETVLEGCFHAFTTATELELAN